MSGRVLSFSQYIGGADDVKVIEKFPSEQQTFTYNYNTDITTFSFEMDAQTIVVDTLAYNVNDGAPNFTTSNVIGYFANINVDAANVTNRNNSGGTVNITMPANLYTGNVLMPDARTNVPITVFSVQWTDTTLTNPTIQSHRWAVIERYKPGDKAIGNILADTGFVSLTS